MRETTAATGEKGRFRGRSWTLVATLMVVLWLAAAGGLAQRAARWKDDAGQFRGRGGAARETVMPAMRVDVNHADAATLALLPGVGPKLAQQIITQRGIRRFERPEDLMRVSGIGAVVVQRISPLVDCR
ncbi:MAG: ComEA family DNA-binding protein [Phycisphaerales bacterium]